ARATLEPEKTDLRTMAARTTRPRNGPTPGRAGTHYSPGHARDRASAGAARAVPGNRPPRRHADVVPLGGLRPPRAPRASALARRDRRSRRRPPAGRGRHRRTVLRA